MIDKYQFRRLLEKASKHGHLDKEKIAALTTAEKNSVVTYLLGTNRPICKEFIVTDNTREKVKKKGYTIEKQTGDLTFLYTYFQSIVPK